MKQSITATLAFLALFCLIGCASAQQHQRHHKDHRGGPGYRIMPPVFWENGDATVTVKEVGAGLGTGAVIRKDGYVITNWHVVAPKTLKIVAEDGSVTLTKSSRKFQVCQMKGRLEVCSPAKLIKGDADRDLALLKTERRFPHEIAFVEDSGLQPFDFVYSWANVSVILPVSPFRGRYINRAYPEKTGAKIEFLVIDLSLNPGGSGSPVFDRTGKCIGIAMGVTALRGAPLEIVIPSKEVVAFLRQLGFKPSFAKREVSPHLRTPRK